MQRLGRLIGDHAADRVRARQHRVLTGPQARAADVHQHFTLLADPADVPCAPADQPEHAARRIALAQQLLAGAEPAQHPQLRDARLKGRRQRSKPAAAAQHIDLGSVG